MSDKFNLIRCLVVAIGVSSVSLAATAAHADGVSVSFGGGFGLAMDGDEAGLSVRMDGVAGDDEGLPLPRVHHRRITTDDGPSLPSFDVRIDAGPIAGDSGRELADKLDDMLALEEARALGHDKLLPQAKTACLEIALRKMEIMQLIAKKDEIRRTTADKTLRNAFIREIDERIAHLKQVIKEFEKRCDAHYKK